MPRADVRLVELGFATSRSRAQAEIAAGNAFVGGRQILKASEIVEVDAEIELRGTANPYVSRGALKLIHALDHFGFDPRDRLALDIGASTGGFTQVLLERGAWKVMALDVGHGQMNPALVADPRVILREGINARHLTADDLEFTPDFIVADVSFISLRLALAPALDLASPEADLVALIKPQFEAGREAVEKGLVRSAETHARVRQEIRDFIAGVAPWRVLGDIESPILGQDGNHEFLIAARRG